MSPTRINSRLIQNESLLSEDIKNWTILLEDLNQEVIDKLLSFEQWIWFTNSTYLYTVFWEDDNWESIRNTRDLTETKTTWTKDWDKPTTLEEVQNLTYE